MKTNIPIVLLVRGLLIVLALASVARAQSATPTLPGAPAPAEVAREIRAALALAVHRVEARDLEGVMVLVSEEYRTGYLTKRAVRAQLQAIFQLYEALSVRVRVEEIRLVGEHAWIVSTGEVFGRLPFIGQWTSVLSWERELEIARREAGGWRLYGYQR